MTYIDNGHLNESGHTRIRIKQESKVTVLETHHYRDCIETLNAKQLNERLLNRI